MTFAVSTLLFAQANMNNGGAAGNGLDPAAIAGLLVCWAVFFVVSIVVHVLFALNLARTLQMCDPRNRTMEPGQVWLNFIPLFNFVWIFITIFRVAETLDAEYQDRGMRADGDFGKTNGLVGMISAMVGCSPVAIVFYIIYWVKMAGYRKELAESGRGGRYRDDDDRPSRRRYDDHDDEDDDRPSRRRNDD